ncbi:MAG: hypothetical protein MUP17_03055 [candidate division Zixibacteria bacterium]|nr:hypothetical protein [candidate division Zixibacteria bacterium]
MGIVLFLLSTILGTIIGWFLNQQFSDFMFRKSIKKVKNIDDYYKELALSIMTSKEVEILNLRDAPIGKDWNEQGEGRWRGEYFAIESQIIEGKKPREIIKGFRLKGEIPFLKRMLLKLKNDNKLKIMRRLTTIGIRERTDLTKNNISIPINYPLKFQSIMEDFAWAKTRIPQLHNYQLKVFEHIDFQKLDNLLSDVLTNLGTADKRCSLADINQIKSECKMVINLLLELKSHDYPTLMSVVLCDEKRVFLGFHKPYRQQHDGEFTYIIITEPEIGRMFHQYFNILWGSREWARSLIWEDNDITRWANINIFKNINSLFYKEVWDRLNKIENEHGLNNVKGNLVFDNEVILWNLMSICP